MSPRDERQLSPGASASATPEPTSAGERRGGLGWALAPFLILGGGLAGLGVMTALAVDDPSFALERDYYRKAVELDARRAQEARNRELGWELYVESVPDGADGELLVTLLGGQRDIEGPKLLDDARITAEAFHNARAADIRDIELEPVGEGKYRGQITKVRPGLWELRFTVERHGSVFTSVQRHVLGPKGRS